MSKPTRTEPTDTEELLMTVPGIGPKTALRIHEALGLETLEGLEVAAYDGRLARASGWGPSRIIAMREVLSAMLDRTGRPGALADCLAPFQPPSVATLLAVDEEYRIDVEANALEKIAPRRFNPTAEAWLPVLNTDRDGWRFTALFSNTPRANELHTTWDWVVLSFEGKAARGQATIVTETRGALAGRRVVRGREGECARYYRGEESAA